MKNSLSTTFEKWIYPDISIDFPEEKANENLFIIAFELKKRHGEEAFTNFRAKAPEHMIFGDLFYHFINDYNGYSSHPIEYLDENKKRYAWVFYFKPKWWQFKKYINPTWTLAQNNIKENSVIICHRVDAVIENLQATEQPPVAIAKEGSEAVNTYFSEIKKESGATKYLFEAKLLIIGEGGTGKTTFLKKMQDTKAAMPQEMDTTLGISIDKWSFDTVHNQTSYDRKVKFNVNMWDFGGQNIYKGTHQIFFSDKSFYVLIADTRELKTDFSYWLNTVEQLGGENSSVIIVVNKKFGHEHEFDEIGYRKQFGKIIKEVFSLDLKNDDTKINAMRNKIKLHLTNLPDIGDALPPSWVAIREDLLQEDENFISFDKFRLICSNRGVKDFGTIETISKYFHRLGIFTHYIEDEILFDRVYLNSNWLVKTVYQVLDSPIVKIKRGKLNDTEIKSLWSNNEIHYEIQKFCQLLNKFGLMYFIPQSNEYVVPSHLPIEMPYENWKHADDIYLQFIYEFDKYMPEGIMSRLIVLLNHHIVDQNLVWQRGINISSNGADAEIIQSYGAINQFVIRISGINSTELLAIIRERFAEAVKPFSKLFFKQLVPCVCSTCKNSNDPAFHDYSNLLKFRMRGLGSQCSKTGQIVMPEELLKITAPKLQTDNVTSKNSPNKTIKVFLASSSELSEDRKAFEIFINRENKMLSSKGVFLHLEIWEDYIDSMSQTRLQDEYNKGVSECDIFICLFFSKVGKYTAEEFENAWKNFQEKGKPIIYTYYKSAAIYIDQINKEDMDSKFNFQEKLKLLGHFPTNYQNADELKYKFKQQMEKILATL